MKNKEQVLQDFLLNMFAGDVPNNFVNRIKFEDDIDQPADENKDKF